MHDAWFFVGIFVFIFLIWVATGGPLHQIAFTGPRLAQPGALGGGTYLQLPRAPMGIGSNNVSLPGSSDGGGSLPNNSSNSGSQDQTVPTFTGGTPFGTPSPYRGLVTMGHYVSGAGAVDPKNEYIEISIAQDAKIPVDITGWRLVSDASGRSISIPKGTEVPTSGVVNAAEDIVITPGNRAIIVTGGSPIGASFRENKCTGYFSSFQTFYPSLPQNCPMPSDELAAQYGANYIRDPNCISAVNKLSRCQVALSPPAGLSGTCQSLIVKYFNYNGCVEAHRAEKDFLSNTWRIYLGRSTPLWNTKYEIVKLLDINGKTVDAFSY